MVRAMKAMKAFTKKSLKPGEAVRPITALSRYHMMAFESAPRIRWVTSYYDRDRDELYTPAWKTTISGRMYWNVWMNASSLTCRTATTLPFDSALDSPTTQAPIPTKTAMKVEKAKKGMKKFAKP
eukprot:NODE_5136_length_610_cov_2.679279.p1 GENE.NODE_5136_length_610_cov_2.679279~~NODE_5136_length_610_cov_2.679279.p1  ORF type:complete len:125 (-),score=26.32 NODE_5136_length_610_cov_2.679279:117-491(-)